MKKIKPSIPFSLYEICKLTGSRLSHDTDKIINTITLDSRLCEKHELFICLETDAIKAEKYIKEARAKSSLTLGESPSADFHVNSAQDTLLKLASLYKSKLKNLMYTIAITGSLGKTTTKELCAHILSKKYKTHATHMNYNNALGVAITMLTAPCNTECLVVEMGMNAPLEIEELSLAVKPTHALITNISSCHIGKLGSLINIAKAKLEILAGMKEKRLLIPYDEPLLKAYANYTFSNESPNADFSLLTNGENHKLYIGGNNTLEFSCTLEAKHHLKDLCAALGMAYLCNIDSADAYKAIKDIDKVSLRQKIINIGTITIFDDTYSSSPDAVCASLELLRIYKRNYSSVSCALGDMLELGEESERLHREIGRLIPQYQIRNLYLFGELSKHIADAALSAGFPAERIFANIYDSDLTLTSKSIYENSLSNELILIKASRALKAERIINIISELEKENVR